MRPRWPGPCAGRRRWSRRSPPTWDERRAHVWIYQLWSRWLTPLFQSGHDTAATLRDMALLPMGRMPGGRGQMLRVLTGTRRGVFGTLGLESDFVDALEQPVPAGCATFTD